MKTFDFYEFTGELCPGVVVLFSAALIVPEFSPILRDLSVTVRNLRLPKQSTSLLKLARQT